MSMLLHQGAKSFEIWTKRKAPLAVMRRALRAAVYGEKAVTELQLYIDFIVFALARSSAAFLMSASPDALDQSIVTPPSHMAAVQTAMHGGRQSHLSVTSPRSATQESAPHSAVADYE